MIHKTAEVSDKAVVSPDANIWHHAQIRENARIGSKCIIGKNVYIDHDVIIGDNVKIQNNALIYFGSKIEDGVFIGPNVCLTNDKTPRAITPDGKLKTNEDWDRGTTLVKKGASIGASSVILPGITVGKFAMVGAASLVTKDVKDYELVYGNPAKQAGYVCKCGAKISKVEEKGSNLEFYCSKCREKITTKK